MLKLAFGVTLVVVILLSVALAIAISSMRQSVSQSTALPPTTGDSIQSLFDGIPADIDRNHVAIIRKELKRTTPTGKWEEIEWRSEALEAYDDTKWILDDIDQTAKPRNAAEAAATFAEKRWEARQNGQPLPEPRKVDHHVPSGLQTTVRLRTQNPFGGMSIFEVVLRQREQEYSYKGITDESFAPLQP